MTKLVRNDNHHLTGSENYVTLMKILLIFMIFNVTETLRTQIITAVTLHFQFTDIDVMLHLNLHLQFSSTKATASPTIKVMLATVVYMERG